VPAGDATALAIASRLLPTVTLCVEPLPIASIAPPKAPTT
jgi:hypothetical protein